MAESWMGLRGHHKVQAGRQGMRPRDGAAERQCGNFLGFPWPSLKCRNLQEPRTAGGSHTAPHTWKRRKDGNHILPQVPLNTPNLHSLSRGTGDRGASPCSPQQLPPGAISNSETSPWKQLLHTEPGTSPGTAQSPPKQGLPSSLPTVSLHQSVGDVPARCLAGPDDLHYLQGRHRAQEEEEEEEETLLLLQNALKDHPLPTLPQGAAASACSSHLATLYPEVPSHRVPSLDPGELVLPQLAVLGVKEKLQTHQGLLAAHKTEMNHGRRRGFQPRFHLT